MKKDKRRRLEKEGWKVTGTMEFLGLTDREMALIDMRVSLAGELRRRRLAQKVSQVRFAERIGSSQSRVAKMEAADPSVSIDLLLKALVSTGATRKEIAATIAGDGRRNRAPR